MTLKGFKAMQAKGQSQDGGQEAWSHPSSPRGLWEMPGALCFSDIASHPRSFSPVDACLAGLAELSSQVKRGGKGGGIEA